MDSKIQIVENLISEGEKFNFRNFCIPRDNMMYGGKATPNWRTFVQRTNNIVKENLSDTSPAVHLVNIAIQTRTNGNGQDTFELVKTNLITALRQLLGALQNDVYGELRKEQSTASFPTLSNKVFIVHGHDEKLKLDVERFVHEIGLIPIVLHRQTNEGQTIIEKFEKNSDVGFAFILLTPDEISYTVDQKDKSDSERKVEFRARPNVIFEFGYFVGKLGRGRVCCLLKGNIEVPSDVSGVVYHKIDNNLEEKAFSIIKELKAVGYQIKM
ncbi:TIR domain-containing protein [Mannheimia massilioguelmaensis]|uniref:TIR domain-containing protein n=1 Tax=Mannheimia massilioguelmaensis TaxID=1604354 RepID=UPI0005C9181D|nr:nucleotide-binding protein [Mannheimia massilioguelmaensis]